MLHVWGARARMHADARMDGDATDDNGYDGGAGEKRQLHYDNPARAMAAGAEHLVFVYEHFLPTRHTSEEIAVSVGGSYMCRSPVGAPLPRMAFVGGGRAYR